MNNIFKATLAILFVFLGSAMDAQTIVTDRPGASDGAATIGQGDLQIEAGAFFGREGEGAFELRQSNAPISVFRYGMVKGLELRAVSQYTSVKSEGFSSEGFADLQVGAKLQLLSSEKRKVDLALLSHAVLPVGSFQTNGNRVGAINRLLFSYALGEKSSLLYNVGHDYYGTGNGNLFYALSLGRSINTKTSVFVEGYGNWIEYQELAADFDAGITHLITDHLQLDFSFGAGLNRSMGFMMLGLSWVARNDK